jgi:acetyl-CoA carboxylase biotin carboxyl carrier protein
MDLSQIRELLKIVAESGVAEVEIEEENFKMVVRLNTPNVSIQSPAPFPIPQVMPYYPPGYGGMPQMTPPEPAPLPPAAAMPAPAAAPPSPVSEPATPRPSSSEHTVKAPIVGTFYNANSPDADPFVQVGDHVKPGDVLCIIEAMKLMNEIECDTAGTIKQVLVDNAEPVEYDQPLFVIEKD